VRASVAAALRLLPVPLLLLAAALATLESRGPFWLGTNSDPSYAYALNSLRLVEGRAPTHLDHPGLTVQLLGAAVFRTSHRLTGGGPLADDVLARPETYLRTTARTFLVLFTGSLFLLGLAVFALTERWRLAWIAQLGPLLSPSVLFELTDVKPEPILYLIATLLAAAIGAALAVRDPDRSPFPVLFGALVGLGIATKLTALPLLVGPMLLHRTWRARFLCGLTAAGAFVLCALPAWPNWGLGARFVWRLSSGTGLYGGAVLADARPYFVQWKRVGIEEAPFLLVLGLALAAVLRGRRSLAGTAPARVLRAIVALLATAAAQIALVAKHPYQPRYLVPALALGGLLCALVPYALRPSGIGRHDRAAVVVAVFGLAALQVPRFLTRDAQLREAAACQIQARAHAVASGCRIVSYYRGSSPAFALFHADVAAGGLFRDRLRRSFPAEVFVDPAGLRTFAGRLHPAGLAQECVVLQGSPGGPRHPLASAPVEEPFAGMATLSAARPVFSCGWEAVFRRDAGAVPAR
jgi:hypothetical protein